MSEYRDRINMYSRRQEEINNTRRHQRRQQDNDSIIIYDDIINSVSRNNFLQSPRQILRRNALTIVDNIHLDLYPSSESYDLSSPIDSIMDSKPPKICFLSTLP